MWLCSSPHHRAGVQIRHLPSELSYATGFGKWYVRRGLKKSVMCFHWLSWFSAHPPPLPPWALLEDDTRGSPELPQSSQQRPSWNSWTAADCQARVLIQLGQVWITDQLTWELYKYWLFKSLHLDSLTSWLPLTPWTISFYQFPGSRPHTVLSSVPYLVCALHVGPGHCPRLVQSRGFYLLHVF